MIYSAPHCKSLRCNVVLPTSKNVVIDTMVVSSVVVVSRLIRSHMVCFCGLECRMVCTAHGVHLHAGLHTAHGGHLCAGVLDCTRSAWWCGHGVLQPIYRRRSFIGVSLASLQFQFTQYCTVANSQSFKAYTQFSITFPDN